jgi:hypothetical protein
MASISARRSGADPDLLAAALVGYQQKLQEIDARIADLGQRLGGSTPARAAPKRIVRPAARRRISAAQRKRWAADRKAKAAAATTPAPAKAAKQKRRLSPEGRARIITATKRRWAAARKAKAARKSGAPEKVAPTAAKPDLKRAARTSTAKKSKPAVAPLKVLGRAKAEARRPAAGRAQGRAAAAQARTEAAAVSAPAATE